MDEFIEFYLGKELKEDYFLNYLLQVFGSIYCVVKIIVGMIKILLATATYELLGNSQLCDY